MKKISLGRANLAKLSNEDMSNLYNITIEKVSIKEVIKGVNELFEVYNNNHDLDRYYNLKSTLNRSLELLDDMEQQILIKTL